MSESKAIIFGASGHRLTEAEKALYRTERPWGFILFARNICDSDQLVALTQEMRECTGEHSTPIFIDQEGGRVQRIREPMVAGYPPAGDLGDLYRDDNEKGLRATWLMSRLHAFDLTRHGISANCLPVLDVPAGNAHDVIGNRAYARDCTSVCAMGRAAADGLLAGGVLPVVKHMPGHGRANVDSHKSLPVVTASIDELRSQDFAPFCALNDLPMAMTAHVVYSDIDDQNPATTSPTVISEIIRGEIGFEGLLMSDDISMEALSGDLGNRSRSIISAGCDVVLHCSGILAEMQCVADNTPALEGKAFRRAEQALGWLGQGDDSLETVARREFHELMDRTA